jgi:predicted TIM-barrel fold metal-dependent hydrolase
MTGWMISADSHVCEPADVFTSRVPATMRSRVPHVVNDDGVDYWVVEGAAWKKALSGNAVGAGDRFDWEHRPLRRTADHVRVGAYDPGAFVADNEADGVWGAVVYPTQCLALYSEMTDSDAKLAAFDAYNSWIIEFASFDPGRLKPVVVLDVDDPDRAADDLTRWRSAGAAGALIPLWQEGDQTYDHSRYESLWSAAAALGVPLSMHIGSNRRPFERMTSYASRCTIVDYWVRRSLADMLFSGVFERHPTLRVGSVENEAGWAANFVCQMDHNYRTNYRVRDRVEFADGMLPSDFFRRNVFVTFQEDELAIANRHVTGLGALMWGNDYPHGESTFPRSVELVDEQLGQLDPDERAALTYGNVAAQYHFAAAP